MQPRPLCAILYLFLQSGQAGFSGNRVLKIMTLNSTKAVILAAGYGTRLQPLTDSLPKALVPLIGRPLLRYTITRLLQAGITSIGINTHHHAELMEQFAAAQQDCRIHISHEPSILGSAGGIGGFREFLAGDDCFIVCNADSVSNISCAQCMPEFLRCSPLVTMVLTDNPTTNNVCINEHQEVIDLRDVLRPGTISARLTYTGIACMSREFLGMIPAGASELVPLLLELIRKKPGCVRAVIAHNAAWRDIGTIDSYLQAHREILLERRPLVDENLIPPDALYIGENTYIDADCTCTGFLSIGSNSQIGPGCSLHDCVIWNTTTVPAGSILRNAVCGPGFVINGR